MLDTWGFSMRTRASLHLLSSKAPKGRLAFADELRQQVVGNYHQVCKEIHSCAFRHRESKMGWLSVREASGQG
jgi:hypothetical protein